VKTALHYVLTAIALCILVLTGIVLRGQDAVGALLWGWEDMTTPIATELKHGQQVNYGVYDFPQHKQFSEAKGLAVEHIFVSWLSELATISSAFKYAHERNRWLMITVEPFAAEERNGQQLLRDVVDGTYDSKITAVCGIIGSLQSPVFVRWGHEMETGDVRYPWSGADADSYIAAYRHFSDRCRASAPKIILVWSPRGDPKLTEYYPGNAYVDFVGLSVYSLLSYDLDHFGKAKNFRETFVPRYNRVSAFKRPVMITEMGVSGDPEYQAHWMADFFRSVRHFPLLRTAVYFNAKDSPGVWPEKYGIPDWTIDPTIFE
jgi:endoglucanase